MFESHFRVSELADQWHVSDDTIRRVFRNEEGVIKLVQQKKGKRRWIMLLIPKSVAERVYRRFQVHP